MNKDSSIDTSNLRDQTKFKLNEIIKLQDYFNSEFHKRRTMSKKLIIFLAAFDFIEKILVALSSTSGWVSIIFFASVLW